jgi:hypothetical protein
MRHFWTALPDGRATKQDLREIGDTVVARFRVDATHRGDL